MEGFSSQHSSSSSSANDPFDRAWSLKDIGLSNSKDVHQFIDLLCSIDDKSSGVPEIPNFIDFFSRDMESRVQIYASGNVNRRFGKSAKDDSDFMESVRRMSKLINALCEFRNVGSLLNQTTVVLHRAVMLLEDEFRALLDFDSRNNNPDPPENLLNFYKISSFNFKNPPDHAAARYPISREAESGEYPAYSPETMVKLCEIARTMIAAGYEVECLQAYFLSRRNAARNHLTKLEYDVVLSMDDVAKMPWQSLEAEISRWINAVKACSEVIFPGEKRLGESIFPDSPLLRRELQSNLVRIVVIQLLDFAEATSLSKWSVEKLFKYIDMYETAKTLISSIRDDESCSNELAGDILAAANRVGASVVSIFFYLEDSIKKDATRTPVPGGAVHPLTRYVMNYLKYACEYKDTLEEIFSKQIDNLSLQTPEIRSLRELEVRETDSPHSDTRTGTGRSLFLIQVASVIDRLDANLDKKSDLYKDPSLRNIFLMNNGRYILQKVKGSPEIRQVMGDIWCRRKSTVVREYHKNYQRETWNGVVKCLRHDGIIAEGKVNKKLLKERFKAFTAMLEEIQRTQGVWVVSDEQLQSELRISISGVVIPAYRSFVDRFKQHLAGGRAGKYIKYQPEDVEEMIERLFEGNNSSMGRLSDIVQMVNLLPSVVKI